MNVPILRIEISISYGRFHLISNISEEEEDKKESNGCRSRKWKKRKDRR